jgi:hypothetical protein
MSIHPGNPGLRLGDEPTTRAFAIIGTSASAVWIVALVAEYQLDLRPPGDGSASYWADQAAFAVAQLGYLLLLVGLFRSRPGGDGRFGRIGVGIWTIAVGALVVGQFLSLVGVMAIPLAPIGGLGQIIGSVLTAIAVWRARRWTGWRRIAPAIWAGYTLLLFAAIVTAIPGLTTPALAPASTSPSELAEAVWQVAWFLVGLALYIESGRQTDTSISTN